MCGIIGYIGTKPVVPVLLDGLRRMEYRGYDSAGVALVGEHGIELGPVARALRLEVRDLQWTAGTARDGNRLVDGIKQAVILVAHVRGVRQATSSQRPA